MNVERSTTLAAGLCLLAVVLLTYWTFGPHELAPWRPDALEGTFNVGETAAKISERKVNQEQKLAMRRAREKSNIGYVDKPTLPAIAQTFFSFRQDRLRKDTEPARWEEKAFTRFLAVDAAVAALLALALLGWRRSSDPARQLALSLGLFGFALACFLVNGQARLRGEWFAWPSWSRLLTDVTATLSFGLSLVGFEKFFSAFPAPLEDWQVLQTLLRWRRRPSTDALPSRWYRGGRANLLSLARLIPKVLTGVLLVGTVASSLPYLFYHIRYNIDAKPDGTPWSFEEKLGLGSLAAGMYCGLIALVLLMAFGWLLSVSLTAKLRAGREQCTEEERRRTDWLFAGGLTVSLMLFIFSAGLVLEMVYLAWGDSQWIRHYGGSAAMMFFPTGWALMLLALGGAVFLSRSFGPRPLLKRTALIAAVGITMSFLIALVQHTVVTKLLGQLSANAQHGVSTVVSGSMVVCAFGFFRQKLELGFGNWLDRFMPATVIADGKRRDLTVVFSDLGGYTALSATDEEQALHVAGHFQKAAAEVARRHGGRIVKTIGDAVLWVFATPAEAFAATLQLPSEFKRSAQADKMPVLPVNSGVHFGSLVEAPGGDVYGAAVNLAARLQGVAKDGNVVASSQAMMEVTGGFRFEPMGKLELKNVPTPIACFRILAV